jgi:hypothetical protein
MDYSKKDPSVLRQYRCLPLSRYYSMLLENTPGYEKNTSSSADREEVTRSGGKDWRSDQNSGGQELRSDQIINPRSYQMQTILMKGKEQSHPPGHKSMQHRIVENKGYNSLTYTTGKGISSNPRPQSCNVDHHDGDQWTERRAKHLARPRNVPIAGEEYESESGNEWEDYNHSYFDDRMTPSDKTKLAKWNWQIKRIKSHDYSSDYIKQRSQALDTAQRDYESRIS